MLSLSPIGFFVFIFSFASFPVDSKLTRKASLAEYNRNIGSFQDCVFLTSSTLDWPDLRGEPRKGAAPSAFFENWSPFDNHGWSVSSVSTLEAASSSSFVGNFARVVSSASDVNNFWMQLPLDQYKGKTISMRGIAKRTVGSGDAMSFGVWYADPNTAQPNIPGDDDFDSSSFKEIYQEFQISDSAAAIYVGFHMDNTSGITTDIEAFDVWEKRDGAIMPMTFARSTPPKNMIETTTAALTSASNIVNNNNPNKEAGYPLYNGSTNLVVVADGSASTSIWTESDGTVRTPV